MKIVGHCSKCQIECYEILRRHPETGLPIKVGKALDCARRLTFVLLDGNQMDLTLCETCVGPLSTADFAPLWNDCMSGWVAQSGADHPWVKSQADNGIVGVLHCVKPEK